jgi:hypothetical protein
MPLTAAGREHRAKSGAHRKKNALVAAGGSTAGRTVQLMGIAAAAHDAWKFLRSVTQACSRSSISPLTSLGGSSADNFRRDFELGFRFRLLDWSAFYEERHGRLV